MCMCMCMCVCVCVCVCTVLYTSRITSQEFSRAQIEISERTVILLLSNKVDVGHLYGGGASPAIKPIRW
jgi:hypothetical protein